MQISNGRKAFYIIVSVVISFALWFYVNSTSDVDLSLYDVPVEFLNAESALANKGLVLVGEDDATVPIRYGYDVYYEKYADDPRFTFLRLKDRGHSTVFYSPEGIAYLKSVDEAFDEWVKMLPYDPEDKTNAERFRQDRLDWMDGHLDRSRLIGSIDRELFGKMLAFYDSHIND